jgi:hypothetical protein
MQRGMPMRVTAYGDGFLSLDFDCKLCGWQTAVDVTTVDVQVIRRLWVHVMSCSLSPATLGEAARLVGLKTDLTVEA